MAELKDGFRAVFYKGNDEILSAFPVRETHERAQLDIDREHEAFSAFNYNPWAHAKVEEIQYRH